MSEQHTPVRNIRLSDALWEAVEARAVELGETKASVVRRAVEAYLGWR